MLYFRLRPVLLLLLLVCYMTVRAEMPGTLPEINAPVVLHVQDAPGQPARELALHLRYPGGKLANVRDTTGLMLVLHNWGGVTFEGAPSPDAVANAYNVVAIGVTYYQSGDDPKSAIPYDFGYLQALDALRALNYVYRSLQAHQHPFDAARIYSCGGSGGGNVSQMLNKLAPHTFACIVDLSGMASLTDDIAYNLPGGSSLNARYSRDPASPAYLTKGMQEIRDLGNPAHLKAIVDGGNRCKIVVVHGEDDTVCLAADKHRVVDAMRAAGLDVDAHFITRADVDGTLLLNTSHAVGNRTNLLMHFAGTYLAPDSPNMRRLQTPCNFTRATAVAYAVSDGVFTVAFPPGGLPTFSFTRADAGG